MRGIVFMGGEGPEPEFLRKIAGEAELLVAADSGLIAAEEAGLFPHWVVGDMDSLGSDASHDNPGRLDKYDPERVIRHSPDKDFTDTELALNLLKEKGCDEIWLAGGGGGRMDHLLAIYSLFEKEESPDRWFPGAGGSSGAVEIRCLREGKAVNETLPPGSCVSVLPLGKGPWKAESCGLKWPLSGLNWEKGGLGLSNVALGGSFEVCSVRGCFMVFMPVV